MSQPLRIVFMGTPDFSVPTLRALCESKHEVVAVLTNPDKASGRGKTLTPPPVKVAAGTYKVPVIQPEKVRKNKVLLDKLKDLKPDLAVVVAYGQILPESILYLPKHGCLNVHASLLPKYRGASPIHAALIHGETESGVTIMQMEKGLDTGPMLAKKKLDISDSMTAQDLHDELSLLGASMIVDVVEDWVDGRIVPEPQDDSLSSYAPMMSKKDGEISWSEPAGRIANLIRGVNPWPGAFTHYLHHDKKLFIKLHSASIWNQNDEDIPLDDLDTVPPGSLIILDLDTLLVKCGSGFIQIESLQPAGKKKLSAREFMNGFQPKPLQRFI